MKKNLLILTTFLLASCSSIDRNTSSSEFPSYYSTKATELSAAFVLSDSDVQAYIYYLSVHDDTRDNAVVEVTPVFKNNRTVYYIINMEQGWRLLSADKRGPIILASDVNNSFHLRNQMRKNYHG